MKIHDNWNLFLTIAGIAVLVLTQLFWVPITAGEKRAMPPPANQVDQQRPFVLSADASDMQQSQPNGKRRPLPAISWRSPEFWSGVRDPFKIPKSQRLCSVGFVQACNPPDSSESGR